MVDSGPWTVDRTSLNVLSAAGGTNHAMSGIRRPASDFRLSFAENTPKSDGRQWTVDCGQNQPERAIRRRRADHATAAGGTNHAMSGIRHPASVFRLS